MSQNLGTINKSICEIKQAIRTRVTNSPLKISLSYILILNKNNTIICINFSVLSLVSNFILYFQLNIQFIKIIIITTTLSSQTISLVFRYIREKSAMRVLTGTKPAM